MNKAVFIDRDGVILNDVGHYYIYKTEDVVFNPGVAEGLKLLQDAGYLLIIITNQGGIAKSEYTKKDVEKVHQVIYDYLNQYNIRITETYFCPHHNKIEKCMCRKPENLNIEKAICRFHIDRSQSWMIGDNTTDVEAGQKSGLQTIKTIKNTDLLPYCQHILNAEHG